MQQQPTDRYGASSTLADAGSGRPLERGTGVDAGPGWFGARSEAVCRERYEDENGDEGGAIARAAAVARSGGERR